MKHTLLRASAALLAASALAPVAAHADRMTEVDLATLKRLGAPTVSPDGGTVVYQLRETDLEANKGRTDLWRLDLTDPDAQPVALVAESDIDENSPAFSPDGGYVYFLSGKSGSDQVWRVPVTGGEPVQVTASGHDVAGFKVDPSGRRLAIWSDQLVEGEVARDLGGSGREYDSDDGFVRHWGSWVTPGERSQIQLVDLATSTDPGAMLNVMGSLVGDTPSKPFGGGEEIAWSPDGETLYFALREGNAQEARSTDLDLYAVTPAALGEPVNLTPGNDATDNYPTPSPDGKWLAYAAMARPGYESDRMVLMLRDLATGETRALTQEWDRSVGSIAWAPDGRSLVVTAQDTLQHPAFRVDARTGRVTRLTERGNVGDVTPLADGGMVYTVNSATAPSDLVLMDAQGATRRLTEVNKDRLAALDPVEYSIFSFAGANGETVWGQILKPAGATGKLPVAFLVHGGPQGSFGNSWSYRWNPRIMASQGYAVVTVDFHGSTGYGQAFTDSINRDWGGKPLVDLRLGLAAAAATDAQVDADNACALGASYGGYMMNWIAGNWPDGFQCIVNHAGLFDMRSFAFTTEEQWFDEWDQGGPWWLREDADRWNPVNYVTNWKTPTLVIHGEKDFRVPYGQSIAAYTALTRQDIPAKLLIFPDENHWINKPANSIQWHRNVFAWLDRWLKNDGGE